MSLNKSIDIVIADDHQMFVDGIASAFSENEHIIVQGTANNGNQVIELLNKKEPDVLLLDINMPEMNGIDAARIITKQYPKVRIIVLSMYLEKEFVEELIRIGVSGYILKNTGIKELELAITEVASGKKYFSSEIALKLAGAQVSSTNNTNPMQQALSVLTEREIEVLKLIVKEMTTPEIAEKLFISVYTVETHRKNLIRKLNVKNIAGLVKFAVQNGLD